jgi:hypothetical protein
MKHVIYIALLVVGAAIQTGCQSTMSVTVERLAPVIPPDGLCKPSNSMLGKVKVNGGYIDSLNNCIYGLLQYEKMISEIETTASANKVRKISEFRDSAVAQRVEGQDLLQKIVTSSDSLSSKQPAIQAYCVKTAAFLDDASIMWKDFAKFLSNDEELGAAVDSLLQNGLPRVEQIVVAATSQSAGFGGFQTEGIYTISPADPMYKYVLNAQAERSPISHSQSNVTGDSTIMFVQDSPGQIHVYAVEMDAEKIVRNVATISDKALEAWTKFMTSPVK